ncbi:MAG: hypothetical protein ACRDSZ_02565 [Pseudonocardiaceae bacterium]
MGEQAGRPLAVKEARGASANAPGQIDMIRARRLADVRSCDVKHINCRYRRPG